MYHVFGSNDTLKANGLNSHARFMKLETAKINTTTDQFFSARAGMMDALDDASHSGPFIFLNAGMIAYNTYTDVNEMHSTEGKRVAGATDVVGGTGVVVLNVAATVLQTHW